MAGGAGGGVIRERSPEEKLDYVISRVALLTGRVAHLERLAREPGEVMDGRIGISGPSSGNAPRVLRDAQRRELEAMMGRHQTARGVMSFSVLEKSGK